MARPTVRDSHLLRDDVHKIKDLFGTVSNAYRSLGLEVEVPASEFRRAMAWLPVRPEHAEAIASRWAGWKAYFLKDPEGAPASFRVPDALFA